MTISEVAAHTSLAASTLRFYERRGLTRPVGREGGKRTYDVRALEQLALIDLWQRARFTPPEIVTMLDKDGRPNDRFKTEAKRKLEELDAQIIQHGSACPHPTFATCPVFNRGIRAHVAAMEERASK